MIACEGEDTGEGDDETGCLQTVRRSLLEDLEEALIVGWARLHVTPLGDAKQCTTQHVLLNKSTISTDWQKARKMRGYSQAERSG